MISTLEVIEIHFILIERFGGSKGIRDQDLLDSAINRPFQTFDGQELYPDPVGKAAAIFESIVKNHPFVDGNKRTGYVLARLFLMHEKKDIIAEQEQKYQFVISVADGRLSFEQIKAWFEKHTR